MIREDKRIKENNILRAEPGFVIAVLAVLILLIAAVTIQSALGLKTAVDRTTKAYVSDVAAQLALGIDDRLSLYQENNIIGVWGGTGNKESMQRLIQPVSFDGQGLTCIADTEGNVVISPTDLDPFMRLDDIFKEDSEETTVRNIKRMQENMKEGKNGVFSFVAVDGRELILSYNILKSYDWVLLTLVPADLISYETDRYVIQTFAIVAGTILLFLFFLLILLFIYRNNRRRLEYIAFVDAVTGGMNNAAFCLKLRETLKNARRNEYTVAVINIRNFKMINESFGTHGRQDAALLHADPPEKCEGRRNSGQGKCGRFFPLSERRKQEYRGGKASGNRQGD